MRCDPDEAQRTIDGMADAFQASGIVTTRGPVQEDTPEFFGFEFDSHTRACCASRPGGSGA
eukprot:4652686-Alexandrium_andersonii.AAC.1